MDWVKLLEHGNSIKLYGLGSDVLVEVASSANLAYGLKHIVERIVSKEEVEPFILSAIAELTTVLERKAA
jgi:hypothetical protein